MLTMILMASVFTGCQASGPATISPPAYLPEPAASATSQGGTIVAASAAQRGETLPEALRPQAPSRAWKYIVLHHSATAGGDVAAIDAVHRQRTDRNGQPWLGIGYHFVVGNGNGMSDGQVEATFRWQRQLHGAHAGDRPHNDLGIGICLIGDFDQDRPTPAQIAALHTLVGALSDRYDISSDRILPHRDLVATNCPGRNFPLDEFRR